jgi:hypothetical protein
MMMTYPPTYESTPILDPCRSLRGS